MIGPVGARRLLAVLVVGDAVLGGVVVGVLFRPTDGASRPVRAVTPTTGPAPVADTQPAEVLGFAPDDTPRTTTSVAPPTTIGTITAPSTSPTTVPHPAPGIAEVTTTAPPTVPSTTAVPSTTVAPPAESGEQ